MMTVRKKRLQVGFYDFKFVIYSLWNLIIFFTSERQGIIMDFGEKLYSLRTQAKISQLQLAEILGVSRQTVSKWETGNMLPEIDKLIKISDQFHVSTDYLLRKTKPKDASVNLDRLVLKFLGSAQDMDAISKELVEVMRDGVIDEEEGKAIDNIIAALDEIVAVIEEIKRSICYGNKEAE